jgi:ribonuclease P/MRP protein subunit RPP1
VPLTNPSTNPRIADIRRHYDLLAVRPTDERTLQQACTSADCDIISIDLTERHPYPFKHKTLGAALARGVKFELCYASGASSDAEKRRNTWQNAANIVRATRGRGILVSSGAESAIGCRGPWDAVNLAMIWGLKQDVAKEAVSEAARSVIAGAQLRTRTYRGVIDVVYGGPKSNKVDTKTPAAKDVSARKQEETSPEDVSSALEPGTSNIKKRKQNGKSDSTEDTPSKPPDKKQRTNGKEDGDNVAAPTTEIKEDNSTPVKKGKAARQPIINKNIAQHTTNMAKREVAARKGHLPPDDAKLPPTPGKHPPKTRGSQGGRKKNIDKETN